MSQPVTVAIKMIHYIDQTRYSSGRCNNENKSSKMEGSREDQVVPF